MKTILTFGEVKIKIITVRRTSSSNKKYKPRSVYAYSNTITDNSIFYVHKVFPVVIIFIRSCSHGVIISWETEEIPPLAGKKVKSDDDARTVMASPSLYL